MTEAHWKERTQIAGQQMREAFARAKNAETERELYLKALKAVCRLVLPQAHFGDYIAQRVIEVLRNNQIDPDKLRGKE